MKDKTAQPSEKKSSSKKASPPPAASDQKDDTAKPPATAAPSTHPPIVGEIWRVKATIKGRSKTAGREGTVDAISGDRITLR